MKKDPTWDKRATAEGSETVNATVINQHKAGVCVCVRVFSETYAHTRSKIQSTSDRKHKAPAPPPSAAPPLRGGKAARAADLAAAQLPWIPSKAAVSRGAAPGPSPKVLEEEEEESDLPQPPPSPVSLTHSSVSLSERCPSSPSIIKM